MSKKALIIVSFGTSFREAVHAIENIEKICQKAFPEYDFFRAFTSGMIIRKMKRTQNITIPNPEELMEKLYVEGYEEVICQPTHIISGNEYEKVIAMLSPYKKKFSSVRIGKPLLTEEEDYKRTCEIVMAELEKPLGEKDAFVLMGHGSDHQSNISYGMFADMLFDLGYVRTYMGTVEGYPDLPYVIKRLRRKNIENVTIMPFMIVAGDHARNDLAGAEADSWDSILKAEGFTTKIILKGLGEIDAIADLFVEHLKAAEEIS